jgi:probable HAF family extracellular repeat protein
MLPSTLRILLTISILLAILSLAHAASYTFTLLNGPGARETIANGINDHGQIVGWYIHPTYGQQGFLYDDGIFTPLDVPGGQANVTYPIGINNDGWIVGWSVDSKGNSYSFFYDGSVLTPLNLPGSLDPAPRSSAVVSGINDRAQAVGWYVNSSNMARGFLYDRGYSPRSTSLVPWTLICGESITAANWWDITLIATIHHTASSMRRGSSRYSMSPTPGSQQLRGSTIGAKSWAASMGGMASCTRQGSSRHSISLAPFALSPSGLITKARSWDGTQIDPQILMSPISRAAFWQSPARTAISKTSDYVLVTQRGQTLSRIPLH